MDPFKRFQYILNPCVSEASIKRLKILWTQKTRYYHNINHLVQILQDIEKNLWFSDIYPFEKRALLLAGFFHDAIYNPRKTDNEDKSIEFFKASFILKDYFVFEQVIKIIESTKHRKRPTSLLSKIFWDADNMGFKKGYATLLKNEKLIRKEFKHISDIKYKEARIKFLKENIGLFDSSVDKDIEKLINYVEKTY